MSVYVLDDDEPLAGEAGGLSRTVELLSLVARSPTIKRIVRIYRPQPTVALTGRERLMTAFSDACEAARRHGFVPTVRPTGGRAVVYDPSCLVIDVIDAERSGRPDYRDPFVEVGGCFVAALRDFGVDARLGPVPGEFCPGEFSVNARGRVKLVGTAQRVVRNARLVGASLALGAVDGLVPVMTDVNEALDLEWDPAAFGSVGHEATDVSAVQFSRALASYLAPDAERASFDQLSE